MKGLSLAVIALSVAGAAARTVVLEAGASFHTDAWCADHHLGEGPSTCIQHSGCCYDGRIGKCHSCDAHTDDWCATYGGDDLSTCVGYSGCTFSYDDKESGECKSNSDPGSIVDEVTCAEALQQAQEGGALTTQTGADGSEVNYIPQCTAEGLWESIQYDEESDLKWCADDNGHEIPDTRKNARQFDVDRTNCEKERKKHAGMQCPNAVTLTTGNGEVMINDHPDVGNCDVSCNTDQDCRADEWCCYNGCGYSCQEPIIPKADCEHLLLDASLAVSGEDNEHGTLVTLSCAPGYFGSDDADIVCKHGEWSEYEMECMKDCEDYRVPAPGRQRDYDISGNGLHHGNSRKIKCVNGYGAIEGSPDAMRFFKQRIECVNGAWEEQSLVCSSCYDAPNQGPHQWWTGIEDGEDPQSSYDCTYFASRPHQCAEYPSAGENCRVSCRTCEEALLEYKVKAVRTDIEGVKHPHKWLKKRLKLLEGFQNMRTDLQRVKVPRRVKKNP